MFEKQQLAFEKFSTLKVGALFMKMGTGKTKVAVDLINYNIKNIDLVLYISAKSTLSNIETELKIWGCEVPYLLVGYETLSLSDYRYMEIIKKIKDRRVFIIADESIYIKNGETKRNKRVNNLRSMCEYALCLNGTPIVKDEWDLYYQMEFLSPRILKMDKYSFRDNFFKKITYRKSGGKEKTFYKFSEVNAEALSQMISPYVFYCDLEFKLDENENINLIEYEGTDYNEIKNNMIKDIKEFKDVDIMAYLTKLNHISAVYKRKNEAVCEYAKGKRVIVYCAFVDEAESIHKTIDSFMITGNTNGRKEIIEAFRKNNKPLIMTYGVGAFSLNLQFCNEIIYSSLTYNFGILEQSKYRIKRIGQESNIKYTYFLTNTGINDLIQKNIDVKKELSDLIKEKTKKDVERWMKEKI